MHPLPRSLDPLPDESLPGYLLRLSSRLDLTPGELGRTTGLVSTSRLSCEEARLLTLSTWRRNYPPIQRWLPPLHGHAPQIDKWILGALDRYCSTCLAGDDSPIQREYGGPSGRRNGTLESSSPVHSTSASSATAVPEAGGHRTMTERQD